MKNQLNFITSNCTFVISLVELVHHLSCINSFHLHQSSNHLNPLDTPALITILIHFSAGLCFELSYLLLQVVNSFLVGTLLEMAPGLMDLAFVAEAMVFYDPTCLEVHDDLLDDFFITFT